MSASCVNRGKPWSRAARAPISTNWTWCRASVVKSSSGSSGAPPGTTRSDTTDIMQETTDVLDLLHPVLGRHRQDTGNVVQHVRFNDHPRLGMRNHFIVRGRQQSFKGVPRRAGLTALDSRDHRLRRTGASGEGALAETGASTRLTEQSSNGRHA